MIFAALHRTDATGLRMVAAGAALLLLPLLTSHAQAINVPDAVIKAEQDRIATMEQAKPAVVAIFAAGGKGGGSGVLIDPAGYAVTNFHVVSGLGGFMKCGLSDGKIYDAVLVGLDPTGDVALIQLLGRDDFPQATIGDSNTVQTGDCVFAMGNPFLLATDFQPTVTAGMVSGVHRYQYPAGTFLEYTDCLQVDASINPGNSGGPLFNCDGELIGINGRISVEKRGRVNVGAGYAISINQVMNFLDHLKSGRIVDHATLGATVAGTAEGSVVIANILESSEAYRRGLRRDDELISFAGRPIRSVNQFKNVLGIYPKGWTVPLSFRRENQRHDIQVRLMALHNRAELLGFDGPLQEAPQEPKNDKPDPLPDPPTEHPPARSDIPEEYADLYSERKGYANYHFNAIAQQRLLKSVSRWGDFSKNGGGWGITAKLNDSTPVEFRLLSNGLAARVGEDFFAQDLSEDFADIPPGTGGLLVALEQLKQLLIDPHAYFTELYYLGSEPYGEAGNRHDVLVTTRSLVTCKWYFDKSSGELVGFETALEEGRDPCEVRFGPLMSIGGVQFPQSMEVRHGDTDVGTLRVESVQFAARETSSPQSPNSK